MKKAEIKFVRFNQQFGRLIATGQLHEGDKVLFEGTIAQLLNFCDPAVNKGHEAYTITNAQEILDLLVRKGGFAS